MPLKFGGASPISTPPFGGNSLTTGNNVTNNYLPIFGGPALRTFPASIQPDRLSFRAPTPEETKCLTMTVNMPSLLIRVFKTVTRTASAPL